MYNWQLPNWPKIYWDENALASLLTTFESIARPLCERASLLPPEDRFNYTIEILINEATNTSSIEGEYFQPDELKSSVVNNITNGMKGKASRSKRVNGISELVGLVRKSFQRPFSETELKYWHEILLNFDEGLKVVGDYRKGPDPMQIVSGSFQRRIVHFEAPPAAIVPAEMQRFVSWVNKPWQSGKSFIKQGAIRSGAAHLYFETIHPFEDGNGRVGRAISDKILAIALDQPNPFSLSKAIQERQNDYYDALNEGQKSLDITEWLKFFLEVLVAAAEDGTQLIEITLEKARFFERLNAELEERQRKALLKMWAVRPGEFKGGMTTRKYTSITRASRATAARDLDYLVGIGALKRRGAGRSTHYVLSGTPD